MMLSEKLSDALNTQINKELYSAYLYTAMAAYCDANNLPGFGHWMMMQAQEEVGHAMKMYTYMNDRGNRVVMKAIDEPPADYDSPLDVFEKTLEHEQTVTQLINNLYGLSLSENDYQAQIFLQWFVSEQVEEEKSVSEVIDMLKMVGDKGHGLLMIDKQLAARMAPAATTAQDE